MNKFTMSHGASALGAALLALAGVSAQAAVTDFENLPLAPNSHYAPGTATSFVSGGVTFKHNHDADYGSWTGWVYANETDTTTPGYENQYSVYGTGGQGGSSNFGISYIGSDWLGGTYNTIANEATLASPSTVSGAWFNNTTYAALSMKLGDSFTKTPFGGLDGDNPDFFKLTISGIDALGNKTGSVDFFLADYRFADNSLDYIVDTWTYVDLSSLGVVSKLSFDVDSSNKGDYGINTPAYFAIDKLVTSAVPESGATAMTLAGLLALGAFARRRRQA